MKLSFLLLLASFPGLVSGFGQMEPHLPGSPNYAAKVLEWSTFWPSQDKKWHPDQALGPPSTTAYGDSALAATFYSRTSGNRICGYSITAGGFDGFHPSNVVRNLHPDDCWGSEGVTEDSFTEMFTVQFDREAMARGVRIGQNRGAGAVTSISGWDHDGWKVLWEVKPENLWFSEYCPDVEGVDPATCKTLQPCCSDAQVAFPGTYSPQRCSWKPANLDNAAAEALGIDPGLATCVYTTSNVPAEDCNDVEGEVFCDGTTMHAICPGDGEGESADCTQRFDSENCLTEGEFDSCVEKEYITGPPLSPDGFFDFGEFSSWHGDILRVTVDTRTIDDWNEFDYLELL